MFASINARRNSAITYITVGFNWLHLLCVTSTSAQRHVFDMAIYYFLVRKFKFEFFVLRSALFFLLLGKVLMELESDEESTITI